ncbi:MAG: hypothetical protein WCK74_01275 [Gemmatimonadaceae bacterium]|jgi:hypothetical protein
MYRIWIGLDPHLIMGGIGSFIAGAVLTMHLWAYSQFNWPGTLKAKYATPTAATR